jgi:acyl-CoA synthetase (AMP-forming)/AMP-acid ligase II
VSGPGPSIWQLVERRVADTPDAVCLVEEDGTPISFAAWADMARRAAAGLHGLGVGAGSVVSWQLPSRLEATVLLGALARLGAVQNPLLPIYRERELRFITAQAAPDLLVTPTVWRGFDHGALAREVTAGTTTRLLTVDAVDDLPRGDPTTLPPAPPSDDADSVRWLFYTSGTTADPKGARHRDASIRTGATAVARRLELTPADRYPIVFPFTHIGGVGMFVAQLVSGCSALLIEQFDPDGSPALMAEHGITIATGGTPMALLLLAAQRRDSTTALLPDVRAVMTGAAPKPDALHAELRAELGGVGAVSVYGLTEAPFAAVSGIDDPEEAKARSEGRSIEGADIRIVGDDGRQCAPGVDGEIRIGGTILCTGYLDSSRDAESFDAEGFLRTGDLGHLDADGFLHVTGRIKDVIIRKGENVAATEVEAVLYTHPDIADVAVVGLPDTRTGERACAVVVAVEGRAVPDLSSLADHCRAEGLATQKIPEQVEGRDELPRNASGKVLKYVLREELADD